MDNICLKYHLWGGTTLGVYCPNCSHHEKLVYNKVIASLITLHWGTVSRFVLFRERLSVKGSNRDVSKIFVYKIRCEKFWSYRKSLSERCIDVACILLYIMLSRKP